MCTYTHTIPTLFTHLPFVLELVVHPCINYRIVINYVNYIHALYLQQACANNDDRCWAVAV